MTIYNVLNVKGHLPNRLKSEVSRMMRITFSLWILAFVFGLSVYIYYIL